MKADRQAPIGVFDSGVGGLTVVREIMRNLPDERIVYFGDTCDSEYIGNLQVKLGKCEYKSMEQAFKDKDIIPNNLNTEFDIPHSAIEKEQGYNFY